MHTTFLHTMWMVREMQYVLKYLEYSLKLDQSFVGSVYLYLNAHNVSTLINETNQVSFIHSFFKNILDLMENITN